MKTNIIPKVNSIYNENETIEQFLFTDTQFHANIGKLVKFKNIENKKYRYLNDTYKIKGIQKDYNGNIVYRVYNQSYDDTCGCCMAIAETDFIIKIV